MMRGVGPLATLTIATVSLMLYLEKRGLASPQDRVPQDWIMTEIIEATLNGGRAAKRATS